MTEDRGIQGASGGVSSERCTNPSFNSWKVENAGKGAEHVVEQRVL